MTVFLESEEYGYEEFEAHNIKEAVEIIKRLYRNSKSAFKGDGVERKIGIIVRQ